jgi:hypothetical protein
MKAEKVHLLALKPDEKPLEFINPSKRAFIDKAFFVDGGVKMAPAIMIASNHLARRKNVAVGVRYRDDVAGFRLFSALIGDCFAPFFAALWLPSRLRIATFSS